MKPMDVRLVWNEERQARVWRGIVAEQERRERNLTIATCLIAFAMAAVATYAAGTL